MPFINLHTHQYTADPEILEVVNQYPWEFSAKIPQYSIGIHPWYIKEDRLSSDLQLIEEKLKDEKCLALGECGLDKRIEIPLSLQTEVFQQQIELVQQTTKPIILHCVAAYQELIAIKKEMDIQNPMIVHGFSKNEQVAKSLLDNGLYLSFGKYLLRNPDLEKVFKFVPENCFFLETDTIEEGIAQVYQKAATVKNLTVEQLQQQVIQNFEAVFKRNK
ncbi:hydrolase TatD [Flavobacterium sediminis]|uniref:Hydrolase TatD n=1 Tax=Flavobacterium sediminis TaxID=2201181 RepID=A0A2U8QR05_9FLAO|nr:TatD family hydrolase [Flavobacterium sediminis]AWM12527.1 hydrolase TatD [Flavobacterium sediminis]